MGRVLYWWTQMFLLLFQVFLISQAHLGSSLPVEEDRGVYEWIFGEETTTSIATNTTTTSTTTTPTTTTTTTTATTTTTTPEPTNLIDVIQDFIWGTTTTTTTTTTTPEPTLIEKIKEMLDQLISG